MYGVLGLVSYRNNNIGVAFLRSSLSSSNKVWGAKIAVFRLYNIFESYLYNIYFRWHSQLTRLDFHTQLTRLCMFCKPDGRKTTDTSWIPHNAQHI